MILRALLQREAGWRRLAGRPHGGEPREGEPIARPSLIKTSRPLLGSQSCPASHSASLSISPSQVDLVLVPAVTGDFGVMPGHVPTVAQLRPGVLTIHTELDKAVEKYFVSAGFAFVHADSTTDVCAVEAVRVEDLDPEAVRAGLAVSR